MDEEKGGWTDRETEDETSLRQTDTNETRTKNYKPRKAHKIVQGRGVKEMNKKVAENMGRTHAFSSSEWSLEEKGVEKEVMLNIAKARWIYHCERVKLAKRQRRRLNTEIR